MARLTLAEPPGTMLRAPVTGQAMGKIMNGPDMSNEELDVAAV
ncbi:MULTISPECIES: hypothetical protein [unclassified Nonomuraea]